MNLNAQTTSTFLLGAIAGATLVYGLLKSFNHSKDGNNTPRKEHVAEVVTGQDSTSALSDLLQNTAIEYILTPTSKPVILIEYHSTTDEYRSSIDFALMLMEDNNIVSIPVVCLEKRRYLGMLNVLDIVAYLASNFTSSSQSENKQELATALRTASVAEVLKSNREPFLPLYATSPLTLLLHVMTTLADEVPIMGSECQIVNIVHRVDVLKFIQDNIDTLGVRADYEIHTLVDSLHISALETVDTNSSVVEALQIMDKTGVSELAIVNTAGKLEGNLVAADLRRLSMYNLPRLYEPVSKFVSASQDGIVWVEPSATLRSVINKFVETKAPVVWIVDSSTSFRPIDSITLRTIMKLLLDFASNPPTN